ncbi:unnamed protein product [Caenorhabditis auriculariae]|uniref:Uncharacterized protein n=1 Tax=Caenorhabditis auriculariae TaxID=2777116 RepID=A0A8S1HP14_9PELO|nr:unnamed protein product [Caenorhabditis auriculariae]
MPEYENIDEDHIVPCFPSTSASSPEFSKKTEAITFLLQAKGKRRLSAFKIKYSKRISLSLKFRVWKAKVDKECEKEIAERKKNFLRLKRERERLLTGQSELAMKCEALTENTRLLRASFERHQALYLQSIVHSFLQAKEMSTYM